MINKMSKIKNKSYFKNKNLTIWLQNKEIINLLSHND